MIRLVSLAVISLIALLPVTFARAERPNVVWIIADDLSPDLGCYGYDAVATPNIDRLAERGARFTNAFATAPVCSSSRSALITGVFQTTTATHQHRTLKKSSLAEPYEPITEELQNLADDPQQAETLAQLRTALDRWIEQTDDQGRFPEASPAGMREIIGSSDAWYRGVMKKRGLPPDIDPERYLGWWEKRLGLK